MVGGWYDLFLPWQLDDYARMRAAGRPAPAGHRPLDPRGQGPVRAVDQRGRRWFRAQLGEGDPDPAGKPVELYVGGAGSGASFGGWPPAGGTRELPFVPVGVLAEGGQPSGVDRFRYDPADPTPSPGGPLLTPAAGRRDNTAVEARADVLTYSTPPLADAVEAIGPVTATIRVRSSSPTSTSSCGSATSTRPAARRTSATA